MMDILTTISPNNTNQSITAHHDSKRNSKFPRNVGYEYQNLATCQDWWLTRSLCFRWGSTTRRTQSCQSSIHSTLGRGYWNLWQIAGRVKVTLRACPTCHREENWRKTPTVLSSPPVCSSGSALLKVSWRPWRVVGRDKVRLCHITTLECHKPRGLRTLN